MQQQQQPSDGTEPTSPAPGDERVSNPLLLPHVEISMGWEVGRSSDGTAERIVIMAVSEPPNIHHPYLRKKCTIGLTAEEARKIAGELLHQAEQAERPAEAFLAEYPQAQEAFRRANSVIEAEHPLEVRRSERNPDVFYVGRDEHIVQFTGQEHELICTCGNMRYGADESGFHFLAYCQHIEAVLAWMEIERQKRITIPL